MRSHDIIGLRNDCHRKWMSFVDDSWGRIQPDLLSEEYIQIISSAGEGKPSKPGALIKHGDNVILKSYANENMYMGCECGSYCVPKTCPRE